jgi:hypothetical protein
MRNFFEPAAAAPSWLRQVLTSIRAALGDIWPAPLRLKDYATAELPAAADFAQGLVWDGTLSRVSVSDGAAWIGLQPWDSTLAALAGLDAAPGILVETAADTFAKRSLAAPAAGLTIANPAGTAGNPTFALANDLAALEGLAGAGLAARTGTDAWAVRTLTGPAAGITVSNGSGAAGNPTLALANDLAALEALSGTSTIYYRSGADTWSAVTIGGNLGFSAGTLGSSLGTAAIQNIGASGATVPLLNVANTWSADQIFTAGIRQSGTVTFCIENTAASLPSGRTGAGIEIGIASGTGLLQCFNRTSSAYVNMTWSAAQHNFQLSGSTKASLLAGAFNLATGIALTVNGVQVVTARITGWAAATNTKSKATFDTTTVTTAQLAARLGQLIDDLMTHGLIGT